MKQKFLTKKGSLRSLFKVNDKRIICDVLRNFVPFVQFKKHEKHPWRSVNFSKVAVAPHI